MATRKQTADVRALTSILEVAERKRPGARGHLVDVVLGGVVPQSAPDARGQAEQIPALLAEAVRYTSDDAFGVRLAAGGDPRRFGVLMYAAASSEDLAGAFARAARYLALWNEGIEARVVDDDGLGLTLTPVGATAKADALGLRQLLELSAATVVTLARLFTGVALVPRSVEITGPRPAVTTAAAAAAHEEAYGVAPRFAAPVTRVLLDDRARSLPLVGADPALAAILDRHADELLARLGSSTPWVKRVRTALANDATPDLATVARALAATPRTLQRRLREEGTSFGTLLDESRFALAVHHLREPSLTVSEIAFLVGFAELSAFFRAFKRWTGVPPNVYRAQLTS